MNIIIDKKEVNDAIEEIEAFSKTPLFKNILETISGRFLGLLQGRLSDDSICFRGTATSAGNHVIILGIGGDLEFFTAALRTKNFKLICSHNTSPL